MYLDVVIVNLYRRLYQIYLYNYYKLYKRSQINFIYQTPKRS